MFYIMAPDILRVDCKPVFMTAAQQLIIQQLLQIRLKTITWWVIMLVANPFSDIKQHNNGSQL